MRILTLTLDPMLLDPASIAMKRQHAYYAGHETTLVVMRKGKPVDFQEKGIHIRAFGGSRKPVVFMRALIKILGERTTYDLVIAQDVLWLGLMAYIITQTRGGKLITQLHGDYLDNPKWVNERWSNPILNSIGKWILGKSDGVRTVSKAIEDYIVDTLHYPRAQTISIPIGTEMTLFQPEGIRANIAGRYVIFAQRLIPEKSPMYFVSIMIDLMRKYPDLHAVVAGVGILKEDMVAQFRNSGLSDRTHFLGQIGMAELATYYRGATCLLHTAGWEGWGMPMIEAMACGAPVVTTNTGCAGEAVIHDRNGIVTPIDDVDGLRRGVDRLLSEPETLARMKASSIVDARLWSFATLSEKLRAWYEERKNA